MACFSKIFGKLWLSNSNYRLSPYSFVTFIKELNFGERLKPHETPSQLKLFLLPSLDASLQSFFDYIEKNDTIFFDESSYLPIPSYQLLFLYCLLHLPFLLLNHLFQQPLQYHQGYHLHQFRYLPHHYHLDLKNFIDQGF